MTIDDKIIEHFSGLAVRKDLTKLVKGNAVVPSYVLEYLLGQYCATDDESTIDSGIETVKAILSKHYVHREESELVKSKIKETGRYKIIDKITVTLNDRAGTYEASFSNLGLRKVLVNSQVIKKHPKLLVGGVWCILDMEYEFGDEKDHVPWVIDKIKPIQIASLDFEQYQEARKQFSLDEWLDVLMQSIGLNPEQFSKRNKLLQLTRLIPFCERNYNLIELGPKGTGKSHVYSEFSPHGILVSGGEVSVPKLFVSNHAKGKIGLVGFWDVVSFDEFAGKSKRVDKNLVDIMKNYMANKSFSRGTESIGAEASMVFMGNTQRSVELMLRHSDLFEEMPEKYYDSAFLDRLHFYIAGWEIETLRNEMFTKGYGLIVDYLAEILKNQRPKDYSQYYCQFFETSTDIAIRDMDAIRKTFSGLMKILFPNEDATKEEVQELLSFAMEGRKRVKDQIVRIDDTFAKVDFSFRDLDSQEVIPVLTAEDIAYPELTGERKQDVTASDIDPSSEDGH